MDDFLDTRMHPEYQEPSCWDTIWKVMVAAACVLAFIGALALIGASGYLLRSWGLA